MAPNHADSGDPVFRFGAMGDPPVWWLLVARRRKRIVKVKAGYVARSPASPIAGNRRHCRDLA
jgi:hypothetical protein